MKSVLHVGCGQEPLNKTLLPGEWNEVRLDIDPACEPHIVLDMRELSMLQGCQFDALLSSHNLEHLHDFDVEVALKGFAHVLKAGGHVVIACPDLQSIAAVVAADNLEEIAYQSPAGPIAAIDMIFGYRPFTQVNPFQQHKTGFTAKSLKQRLENAGFVDVTVRRDRAFYNLVANAYLR
jgi:ubiquinone/menaquinone biosynthesis C-methylase UbiE